MREDKNRWNTYVDRHSRWTAQRPYLVQQYLVYAGGEFLRYALQFLPTFQQAKKQNMLPPMNYHTLSCCCWLETVCCNRVAVSDIRKFMKRPHRSIVFAHLKISGRRVFSQHQKLPPWAKQQTLSKIRWLVSSSSCGLYKFKFSNGMPIHSRCQ